MTYSELKTEQKNELKANPFYALDEVPGNEELTQDDLNKINEAKFPEDIPDDVMEKLYGGYNFVDEDFWCTSGAGGGIEK